MSLTSALNWYHKKIGAYDKKLWEKSVDQRILRGVCAIPRKTARLKTELIDVDLVQGSAFAKAKPQDSWIVSTTSGIKRILLLPLYFSWWQVETNIKITCLFVSLYFLQIFVLYLYFSAEDTEISDVPVFEVITPLFMMLILGVVHSQIVATFTSPKSCRKITRTKRRRAKCKLLKKSYSYEQDKSSPDSSSDFKSYRFCSRKSSQTCEQEDSCTVPQSESAADLDNDKTECCTCEKDFKSGQNMCFSLNEFKENDENSFNFNKSIGIAEECDRIAQGVLGNSNLDRICNFSEESYVSQISRDSAYGECNHPSLESLEFNSSLLHNTTANKVVGDLKRNSRDSVFQSSIEKDCEAVSSGEDYFVAKKSTYTNEEWMNYIVSIQSAIKKNGSKESCLDEDSFVNRRYSDIGPVNKKLHASHLLEKEHTQSAEDIFHSKQLHFSSSARHIQHSPLRKNSKKKKCKLRLSNIRPLIEPISLKTLSSSCESVDDSPLKNQTSDLEWPLISNTDCNSDSSACSDEYSKDLSDVTPAENPFAWEIYERSKKFSTKESFNSGKISCTIWEGNECKKADLTALEISSTIIQKVDSTYHSAEYLYVGFFFATIISLIPLMFRLKNCASISDMQDVASDVLTLNVPSSEEVVRITDGLIELMWGKGLRIKTIVCITVLERFVLSFAFFFLLSVAEKTFKQRFLFAKHFCYLTSSRGAKRSDLPHFRLNKVKNIKTWLSIRSYMKKLGPQRSVDVIVSITFILEVCVVSYLCIQLLKETGQFADRLHCWELLFWTLALGIYLLRFMIIGTKINKKYQNLSVLITEQINLYLHMEQKPHKKEELILANNVLKLAADLLKELESPFKISGICANSYLYNITKVIVLSAFSAILSDVLGFKLKLYKIKLK